MPVLAPTPPDPLAPLSAPGGMSTRSLDVLRHRAALWARLDHTARLATEIERRAAGVADLDPGAAAPARLTTSDDPLDELVAIDAAVVADVLAVQERRARVERNRQCLERCRRRLVARARVVLAVVTLVAALIAAALL